MMQALKYGLLTTVALLLLEVIGIGVYVWIFGSVTMDLDSTIDSMLYLDLNVLWGSVLFFYIVHRDYAQALEEGRNEFPDIPLSYIKSIAKERLLRKYYKNTAYTTLICAAVLAIFHWDDKKIIIVVLLALSLISFILYQYALRNDITNHKL